MGQLVSTPFALTMTHTASTGTLNALEQAAVGLVSGDSTWAEVNFPIPSYGLLSGLSGDGLDWNARIHWDRIRKIAHLIYKAANAPDAFKYVRYDAAANTFAKLFDGAIRAGGGNGKGHAYDCLALDITAGELYFLAGYAGSAVKWNGSDFVKATGNVSGAGTADDSNSPRGQSWHPNLYGPGDGGLIHVRGPGSGGGIMAWRKSLGAAANFVKIGNAPYSGIRYSQGVYCRALDQQILSMGEQGLACLRVVPGTTPQVVQNPFDFPCRVASSAGDANLARLLGTPSGSVAVFESASPYRVWRMELPGEGTQAFAWQLMGFTNPMRNINSSWPTADIDDLGVYWTLAESVDSGTALPKSTLRRPPRLAAPGVLF